MDGTVLDNVKAHVRATEAILRDLGRADIDPREFHTKWDKAMFPFHRHVERAHRFLSISHIMSRCLAQTLKQHMIAFDERSLDKYVMITRKSFIKYGRLFDDTRPALKSLKNSGYSLSIISNADLDVYRPIFTAVRIVSTMVSPASNFVKLLSFSLERNIECVATW